MSRGSHLVKPGLVRYLNDTNLKEWVGQLKPNTKQSYMYKLVNVCHFLQLTPTDLLAGVQANPTEVAKRIKIYAAELGNHMKGQSVEMNLFALQNYLEFNQIDFELKGLRIHRARPVAHPMLPYEEAEHIIDLIRGPYRPVFRFILWGLDAERFVQINNDPKVIKEVKRQLADPTKDWIKITIARGRKNNPNPYYVLVPRDVAQPLPVRGVNNKPITSKPSIWYAWRQACELAGYKADRQHGAHNLKSTFATEATKRGLPEALREFQEGHTVDPMNYNRVSQDEAWVLDQFRKAYGNMGAASRGELEKLKEDQEKKTTELEETKDTLKQQAALIRELVSRVNMLSAPEVRQRQEAEHLLRIEEFRLTVLKQQAANKTEIEAAEKGVQRLRKLLANKPKEEPPIPP